MMVGSAYLAFGWLVGCICIGCDASVDIATRLTKRNETERGQSKPRRAKKRSISTHLARDHADGLPHALHLLDDVVLPQPVDQRHLRGKGIVSVAYAQLCVCTLVFSGSAGKRDQSSHRAHGRRSINVCTRQANAPPAPCGSRRSRGGGSSR